MMEFKIQDFWISELLVVNCATMMMVLCELKKATELITDRHYCTEETETDRVQLGPWNR